MRSTERDTAALCARMPSVCSQEKKNAKAEERTVGAQICGDSGKEERGSRTRTLYPGYQEICTRYAEDTRETGRVGKEARREARREPPTVWQELKRNGLMKHTGEGRIQPKQSTNVSTQEARCSRRCTFKIMGPTPPSSLRHARPGTLNICYTAKLFRKE